MFEEELIAKSLYREIEEYFSNSSIKPDVDLNGDCVNWSCILKMDSCEVSIYCVDISYQPDEKGRTEEFMVSYFNYAVEIACGETRDREELINSIEEWLNSKSKEQLYKFAFVDHDFREFQKLESEWINKFPELGNITKALERYGSGIEKYEIVNNGRSCWSTGFGDQGEVYFGFTWDGCTLFETETIKNETAEVLKRYLIDNESLSSLNKRFSWIPMNDLIESYEKGEGIQGEFIESWKSTLRFYSDFPEKSLPNKIEIIKFIQDLINQEFDKSIRAGTSLTTLIFSRSRRKGLWENQPFLSFEFRNDKVHLHTEKGEIYQLENIQINKKIIKLIKGLEKKEIL